MPARSGCSSRAELPRKGWLFLAVKVTHIIQPALFTQRMLRLAHPPPVPDQPVMRISPLLSGNKLCHLLLGFLNRISLAEPDPVADPEYMRIHRKRRNPERIVQHDVRPMMFAAFVLNPQLFTIGYRSSSRASAIAQASGYRANTAGVTLFTCRSVHCALRIVATIIS